MDEPTNGDENDEHVDAEPTNDGPIAGSEGLRGVGLGSSYVSLFNWAGLQNRIFKDVFGSTNLMRQFAPLQEVQRQQALKIANIVAPIQLKWQRDIADAVRLALPDYSAIGKTLATASGLFATDSVALSKAFAPNIVLPKFPDFAPQLTGLIKTFREQWRKASPPNWPEDDYEKLIEFVRETGWSVVWAPSEEVLVALLSCASAQARESLLVERGVEVAESCQATVAEVTTPRLRPFVNATDEAARAFLQGLPRAAQALASSVVSALIHEELGYKRFADAKNATSIDPGDAPLSQVRLYVILSTVPQALIAFYPGDEAVPGVFSRHGTAHTVSPEQFRPANALTGLMLAASLVRELHQRIEDGLDELEDDDNDEE